VPFSKKHVVVRAGDVFRSAAFYEALLGVPPVVRRDGLAVFELESSSLSLTLEDHPRIRRAPPHPAFALVVPEPQHVGDAAIRLRRARVQLMVADHGIDVKDPDGNAWCVRFVPSARGPAVVAA
jgi:catechol 2,3-dioxygenase-like lactoylglutathione lyase family enzyme